MDIVTFFMPDIHPVDTVTKDDIIKAFERSNITINAKSYILCVDRHYACITRHDLREYIKKSGVAGCTYEKEEFDCDNFAAASYGLGAMWYATKHKDDPVGGPPIGMIVSGNHMFNFGLVKEKKEDELYIYLYEPQNNNHKKFAEPAYARIVII